MFDLIGKTIGPYRILDQIGIGGMAVVYKAYQPSMDRYVAVKVLPAHLLKDPEFARRFQREARAIARLEHAHILPIHDYGEHEGVTYIVMRYVEAGTLRDRLAAGLLSLNEINRLIGQIGSALDYAHRMGIIHRDVKPGNVLIDRQDDTYLSDFGLARMMEPSQQLTASGVGLGTPAYMSPEQGQGVKVDHRSDIYSLGVILYEMLTGRVPYEAETPMAVVLKHINDELPLPHAVNPNVPEPVERVILKALAKDPADRYQTAGELVEALAQAIGGASREPARQIARAPSQPDSSRDRVSVITRLQRAWRQPGGRILVTAGIVTFLIAFGYLLNRIPGQVVIVGSGRTATPEKVQQAPTPSPVVELSPVASVLATDAAVSQTEPIRLFAEPILKAVAEKPPDFEDDFSAADKEWQWHEDMRDQVKIADGKLQVDGTGGAGIWHELLLSRKDFVLEFETRQETPGSMGAFFRLQDPESWHAIEVHSDTGSWVIDQYKGQRLQGDENVQPPGEVNRITLIAKDDQFALYLNGKPTAYFENANILNASDVQLSFWGISEPPYDPGRASPMQGEFDNLKFWDISDFAPATLAASGLRWERVYDNSIFQRADVSAIAVDPQDSNVIYVATSGGLSYGTGAGIYKSVDAGKTWTAVNHGLDHTSVSGVFIDPVDAQIVYATTFGAGPYKSTDGGAHWKPINTGLTNLTGRDNGVSSFVFDPADHTRLYHSDPYEGLFHSTDAGESWQFVIQPCQSYMSLAVDPRDGNHLFAGAWPNDTCPGGLFESADGGLSWTPIAQEIMDIEKAAVWRIVIDPGNPEFLYASVEFIGMNLPSTVITSTNGGKDWKMLRNAGWRGAIAVNPNDSRDVYLAEGTELYHTQDGGRTWRTLRGGFGGDIEALTFIGNTLYVGSTGIYWTDNGGQSWEASGSGFGSSWLEIAFDPSASTLYAEDNNCALYRSREGAATWERLRSPGCGLAFDGENGLLYRIGTHTLHRSADGGETWADTGASPRVTGDPFRLYVSPTGMDTLYALYSCCSPDPLVYRSMDRGQSWKPLPTLTDLYHGRLVIAGDGLRIYAANVFAAEVSDDGGESWTETQATTQDNGNPPALAVQPHNSGSALLGTWGTGILRTVNAGQTWSTANAGLTNLYVNSLVFDPLDPDAVYAGTDGGVFLSQDGSDSWRAVNDGLGPNRVVYSVAVDPNDASRVVVVTPDGVYLLVKSSD